MKSILNNFVVFYVRRRSHILFQAKKKITYIFFLCVCLNYVKV